MGSDRRVPEGYERELELDLDWLTDITIRDKFLVRSFDEGDYLILPWSRIGEARDFMVENGIKHLEVNESVGNFCGRDLNALVGFDFLEGLNVVGLGIRDVSAIHAFSQLKYLYLSNDSKDAIDFSRFKHLTKCGLNWTPKRDTIFDAHGLRWLIISGYRGKSADRFAGLRQLEFLCNVNARAMTEIGALSRLTKLKQLELMGLSAVSSIDPLAGLQRLVVLLLDGMRGIGCIDAVSGMHDLKRLILYNCGEIQSLRPLQKLKKLEIVGFSGTTFVADGDISPLTNLPRLKLVAFQTRKHYNYRLVRLRSAKSRTSAGDILLPDNSVLRPKPSTWPDEVAP